ncbi:MAG: vWA domain-containing protein [Candidatus Helarchaeota archaeon]
MSEIFVNIEPRENLGNKIVINQVNASKLQVNNGSVIIYSDKTSGITGEGIVEIGDCNDYVAYFDSNLFRQFENNMKWMGTFTLSRKEGGIGVSSMSQMGVKSPSPPVSMPSSTPAPPTPSTPTVQAPPPPVSQPRSTIPPMPSTPSYQTQPTSTPTPPTPAPPAQPAPPTPSIPSRPSVQPTPPPPQPTPTIPPRPTTPAPPPSIKPSPQIPSPTSPAPPSPTPPSPTPSIPTSAYSTTPQSVAPSTPTPQPTSPTTSIPRIQPTRPQPTTISQVQKPEKTLTLNIILTQTPLNGLVQISQNVAQYLELNNNDPIMFEDPTRPGVFGGARVQIAMVQDDQIWMDQETYETADILATQVIVFNPQAEPPIVKKEKIELEVEIGSSSDSGKIELSQRNMLTLDLNDNDIIRFEDNLTGAWGAGRVQTNPTLSDKVIRIPDEIYEAAGIGAPEVTVKKNTTNVIPLQNIELGISPISGENLWDTLTVIRNNIDALKEWLNQYVIFKGLKLRWKDANAAIKILSSVPDLTGEILAEVKMTSSINLRPEGLVTFNAILIIDISSSMLARDMYVKNIAPAVEGIHAAMSGTNITKFLSYFKDGINVPRRLGAAFAALLFLAEKVGRGFGEKVAIIRFADVAEVIEFDQGMPFFDSASGKHGILEIAANKIVEKIGEAQGTATNMGEAIEEAAGVLEAYNTIDGADKPCMIVLLTDGHPTDGNKFVENVNKYFITNPNLVFYIVGIGNCNDELMNDVARRCGGEYFKPNDMGELLIWYSKRARDLVVKLKGGRR